MTFEDLMKVSSEQDFVLTEGSTGTRDYVFTNSAGNKLHIRSLSTAVDETLPMWTVDLDGDRVQFDGPAQLLTVNTIVTGLITRSINLLKAQGDQPNESGSN